MRPFSLRSANTVRETICLPACPDQKRRDAEDSGPGALRKSVPLKILASPPVKKQEERQDTHKYLWRDILDKHMRCARDYHLLRSSQEEKVEERKRADKTKQCHFRRTI